MRRIALSLLALVLIAAAVAHIAPLALAQDSSQVYHNDTLGLTFEYPADWVIREQLATRTVLAASKDDMDAIAKGNAPQGLLFTVTFSSFRLIGVQTENDFAPILQKIALAPKLTPTAIRIGGAEGLSLDVTDSGVTARTAILSLGRRRIVIVRGVATADAWGRGASDQLDKLVASTSFTLPAHDDLDSFGQVVWQLPTDKLTNMTGVAISADGTSIYVSDANAGIAQITSNGTPNAPVKPDSVGTFAEIGTYVDGKQYIADPKMNTIWQVAAGQATHFIGGKVGTEKGEFGSTSPQQFAFGSKGQFYVLDENEKGLRIQVFTRTGDWAANWSLAEALPTPIDHPLMSSDDAGSVYLLGRNTDGVIKLDINGKVEKKEIGKDELANTVPLALAVDHSANLYIATADEGILKLDPGGKLIGVIGEAYDESAPPKPGQLGNPVAIALSGGSRVLYVADSGKFPQIVAFALNGNHALNLAAGTRDAATISYGQTVNGEITATTFLDNYSFQGKAKEVITITMRAGDGSQLDPYIELIGPNGARLAFNDDVHASGFGPKDAQIAAFHLPFDGTYVIHATRFGRETTTDTGTYTLALEQNAKVVPTFTLTPSPIPPTATLRKPTSTRTPVPPTLTYTPSQTGTQVPWRATHNAFASATAFAKLPTSTPTALPTDTATPIPPTLTNTPSKTNTPTTTNTPSATNTLTATATRTPTPTHTATATHTSTSSPTNTPSPTSTATATPTLIPPVIQQEYDF